MASVVWSGVLSFGLVTLPVQLVTATESHTIAFHHYQRGTTDRIRHMRVNERTGDEVGNYDIVKGREVDGRVITVEDTELDAIAPGRSRAIAIHCFVDIAEIDPVYLARTYWLTPTAEHQRPYTLLQQAMTRVGRAAVATFVLRGREHVALVRAEQHGGLALTTLRFADEVRDPCEVIGMLTSQEEPSDDEVQAAVTVISAMSGSWKPSEYVDTYARRVDELLHEKATGGALPAPSPPPPEPTPETDLERALRESLAAQRGHR